MFTPPVAYKGIDIAWKRNTLQLGLKQVARGPSSYKRLVSLFVVIVDGVKCMKKSTGFTGIQEKSDIFCEKSLFLS